jgi:GntR family transcriptional regulator/MocR family aminotransferase
MAKKNLGLDIPSLGAIDRLAGNVGQQLVSALREAIKKGNLKAGERLPSSRTLASSLGLSRGTVMQAFDQLKSEGYLDGQTGSGTTVASTLSDQSLTAFSAKTKAASPSQLDLPPSTQRYAAIARNLAPLPPVPFSIAVPSGAVAPDDNWRRLGNRIRATQAAAPSSYGDPQGLIELRIAIADYLRKSRAVTCEPEQIIVTAGTQQGLYLAARVLLSRGDAVWAENPVYPGLTAVLDDFDIRIHRINVDQQGLDVEQGIAVAPKARAVFVTPSHQYPLGMPLSMSRRLALLAWARKHGAWIVEDDYDSELRYAGHPFPSMQGLDPSRVIYLGTFSKVLAPSLRLGYAVVPLPLADAFAGARAMIDRHSPSSEQRVLATYMREGYFEAHIRRIRSVYANRRAVLIELIERELAPWATLQPSDQGMHIVIWLQTGIDDVKLAAAANAAGIAVRAISPMYADVNRRSGLMLGFGGFTKEQLEQGVGVLRKLLVKV